MMLEVCKITKRFYRNEVLRDVSFSVKEGIVFGLLGPNGAGKTTLIRIITRIFFPDEGKIIFRGSEMKDEDVSKVGYLPEERGLYRKMQVLEQLVYLGTLKGLRFKEARERALQWLRRWEIEHWKKKKIEELSKGMQQKIQLLAAILHQPQLLILDEPFSGLDPVNARLFKEEILNLKKQGMTILFSSHNMFNVEEICDEIVLINKASKILEGDIRTIRRSRFDNTYEFHFQGNVVGFTHALWTSGEIIHSRTEGDLHTLLVRLKKGITLNRVLENILPHCELQEVRPLYPSLQEIFIQAVSENAGLQTGEILPVE